MGRKVYTVESNGVLTGHAVECPGCGNVHVFDAGRWTFNGDFEKPTFNPSMLARSGHYDKDHRSGGPCWCTYNKEHPGEPAPFECSICHSFVRNGKIEFLEDSTHSLRGQTVELPDTKES